MSQFLRVALSLLSLMAIAVAALTLASNGARGGNGVILLVDTPTNIQAANGLCSLPEAIIAANTDAIYFDCDASLSQGTDSIRFALGPGTPVINIGVGVPLPPITEDVFINGTTGGSTRVEIRGPGGPLVSGDHGLTVTGNDVQVRGLVITSAADDGILVTGNNFRLTESYIGVFSDGVTALPNQGFGVQIQGDMAVIGGATTGGPCTGECNLISGAINQKANVFLDSSSTLSVVKGNFIGTDVTGTATLTPNIANGQGIADRGFGSVIGGPTGTTPGGNCTGDCNLISGNNYPDDALFNAGVLVLADALGPVIRGNFVGTDVTGKIAIGNGPDGAGIITNSPTALVGGTQPADRNVISGSSSYNVVVFGLASSGGVMGNFIGPDSSGTSVVNPSSQGVLIQGGNGTAIGGDTDGAGNVISGVLNGVLITQSVNVQIQGNLIGTAADGVTPLANFGYGVYVGSNSSNNLVGGFTGEGGNTIAFNGLHGVVVDGSFGTNRSNTIRHNSIHSNSGKGIALLDNGNDALPPPVITGENPLTGTGCAECFIDIYSDNENEGRIHEGFVFTDITGNWTFPGSLTGPNVTATNTDNSDNTSEFSLPFTITPATPTPSPTATTTPTATATTTATTTATPSSPPTATPTTAAQLVWGDSDCNGEIRARDNQALLRRVLEQSPLSQTEPCPDLGDEVMVGGAPRVWGDWDCSGGVTARDNQALLRLVLSQSALSQTEPCPDLGETVTVGAT